MRAPKYISLVKGLKRSSFAPSSRITYKKILYAYSNIHLCKKNRHTNHRNFKKNKTK